MAIDEAQTQRDDTKHPGDGAVALLPEPFQVNAQAVDLAAAAARAALRRTGAYGRAARLTHPTHPVVAQDPFISAALPLKLP